MTKNFEFPLDSAKRLYHEGYSATQIRDILAEKMEISVCSDTVRKRLKKAGVIFRSVGKSIILFHRQREPVSEVVKLYQRGTPIRKLAKTFKIERSTIRKIL